MMSVLREQVCPEDVYDENDQPKITRPEDCTDCMTCIEECPEEAISLIE